MSRIPACNITLFERFTRVGEFEAKEVAVLEAILAGIAGLCVGLGIFFIARRGRRVDDHPVCRRCGFDLIGMPAGGAICSECGTNISQPGARRIGNRARRTGLMALGGIGAVLCMLWLSGIGWLVWRGVDLNQYKPVWLLLREADRTDVAIRDAALSELLRRAQAQLLSDSQVAAVVDRALVAQADQARPWTTAWGDIVELFQSRKKLPPEKWKQYVAQAPTILLKVRPRVRAGAPLPVGLGRIGRLGKRGMVFIKTNGLGLTIDGEKVPLTLSRGLEMAVVQSTADVNARSIPNSDPVMNALRPGRHAVKWEMDVWVYDTAPRGFADTSTPVMLHERRSVQTTFDIVDGDTVTLAKRPDLHPLVQPAIRLNLRSDAKGMLTGGISASGAPMALAMDVFLRLAGQEKPVGKLIYRPTVKTQQWSSVDSKTQIPGGPFDVVLRPSKAAAEETTDITEIWDEEIVLDGQAALRNVPWTRPAASN